MVPGVGDGGGGRVWLCVWGGWGGSGGWRVAVSCLQLESYLNCSWSAYSSVRVFQASGRKLACGRYCVLRRGPFPEEPFTSRLLLEPSEDAVVAFLTVAAKSLRKAAFGSRLEGSGHRDDEEVVAAAGAPGRGSHLPPQSGRSQRGKRVLRSFSLVSNSAAHC